MTFRSDWDISYFFLNLYDAVYERPPIITAILSNMIIILTIRMATLNIFQILSSEIYKEIEFILIYHIDIFYIWFHNPFLI